MGVNEELENLSAEERRAALARLLRKKIQPKLAPLSFAQERLWFLDQFQPGSPAYNMPLAVRLIGQLDVAAIQYSLTKIVARHETLRTTFAVVDERPVQVIAPLLTVNLHVIDLHEIPSELREDQARQLTAEEARYPFDLEHGPLMRAVLLRLEAADHLLLITWHHTVTDGWSMGVFIQELAALYRTFTSSASAGDSLSDLPLQYSDFARWQRAWLQGEVQTDQLAYWQRQLSAAPVALELPTDRPRPLVPTAQGARQSLVQPPALSEALKTFSQREKATLFVTLLAGFSALLYRYTEQTDLIIGSPIANRTRSETEKLIGVFVNTLALRVDLSGNPTFRELVDRVREMTLGAYAHQDLPFEMLVEALGLERDTSRTPLFQVMFVLQSAPLPVVELPDLTLRPVEVDSGTSKFELSLIVVETPSGLRTMFEYNVDLFEAATIARLLGHFQTLLREAVAHPDRHLADLEILTDSERHQLLVEWNNTRTEYAQAAGIHHLFEAQVERTPDAVAVVFPTTELEQNADQSLTYAELNRRANQLAHQLRSLGIGPDVLVGICLERSIEMVVGLLGILKAGSAYVPIDPTYPPERRAFMLADAQVTVLLTQQQWSTGLADQAHHVICLDADGDTRAPQSTRNPVHELQPAHLAYMIYTSGSTGKPKGALNTHAGIRNRLLWMQETYQLSEIDRVLQKTPFSFDVSVWEFFWPLLTGACLVVARPEGHKDSRYLIQTIVEQNITTLHFVPSMLRIFLEESDLETCRSLKHVICSGEALASDLVQRFFVRLNAGLHNLYGPTEAAIDVTFWACQRESQKPIIPIGRPIANMHLHVLDSHLRPVPIGVSGELYIGGVGVGRGYWQRPDLTAARFVPHPFSRQPGERLYRTGDLARYLPDGNLEFLGRVDHQVKVRGFRIELGEIEAVLGQHPAIQEALVIVREDKPDQRRLVAYVVPATIDQGAGTPPRLAAAELRDFLKDRLPEYMVPAAFVVLDSMPLTPNGKVDRRALPGPDEDRPERDRAFAAPRTPTEEVLAGIWAKVLDLEQVGIHDNFFELGGHSLLATQVISRVRQVFQIELPLRELFKEPTVAAFAERIERSRRAMQPPLPPIVPVPRAGPLPLSFAQQRVWFLDQLEPGNPAYNIPAAVRLTGRLAVSALEHSLSEVIQRHEALRTTFALVDGHPVSVIAPYSVNADHALTQSQFSLRSIDLRDLPESDRATRAGQLATEEAQRSFDLAVGPLIRATLLQLDEEEHVLLLTLHHVIADGWSLGVLIREIAALYERFSGNGAAIQSETELSPLARQLIQYVDFAHWQRHVLQSTVFEEQLAYWQHQLAGPLPVLDLSVSPLDFEDGSVRGKRHTRLFSPALLRALTELSRQAGTTLFMTLLAALKVLLYRYTGQPDIVIGSPIALRDRTEVESMIGLFLNTLVLRTDLSGNPTFLELLARVRRVVLEAFDHKDVPFELLVEKIKSERDLGRNPLFQVVFVMQNAPLPPLELPGLKLSLLPLDTSVEVQVPDMLGLSMRETPEGLLTFLEYRADLPDLQLLDHLQTLLESIVAHPRQHLSSLSILPEAERQQLLVAWNDTQVDYANDRCLHHLFEAQAARTPDAVALTFEDQQLTYRELNRQSDQLAQALRRHGVGPEVLVGICAERSLEMVSGLLGILKAGGAYVPLDPTYPLERLTLMIRDAQPAVLLTQTWLVDRLPAQGIRIICLDTCGKIPVQADPSSFTKTVPRTAPASDNLAYMIYTSGSTGTPKGALNTHRGIVNRLLWMQAAYHLTLADRVLQKTPYSFDVSVWEFFWPLLAGAQLIIARPEGHKDSAYLVNLIIEQAVTTLHFVPAMLRVFLEEPGVEACRSLKRVICSGEALPFDLQDRCFARLDAELHNLYGPTEAAVDVTYWACARESRQRTVPIGRPIANTQIYLLDASLNPVPIGIVGELHIGGVGVGRGYLNRPTLTAEKFIPDPFASHSRRGARLYKTGDLARYLPDGNLEFLGRRDDQVKIRGFRIELGEIEATLERQPNVQAAVVVARDMEQLPGDKRLIAYVVPAHEPAPLIDELRDWVSAQLPDYMLPAAFVFLEALPLTTSGKVNRRALPAPDASRVGWTKEYRAPETPLEETLAEIWGQALGIERLGIDDNVFTLGGHSLLATQVIHQINETFEINLPLRSLFEEPTVAGLAVLVEETLIREIKTRSQSGEAGE